MTDFIPLAAALRGNLVLPDALDYDTARAIWNGVIDKRPAAIARCTDTADVVAAVHFARAHDLPLTVRGGGHNVAGRAVCDDGLVIDLSRMNDVTVDTAARTARAGGGATIGDFDRATVPLGLTAPMGVVTETGIAGLTLGGGYGWQTRKHGLSCDALSAAEVVTAEGEVLKVSADAHPDLFWALRGGGGNFGVVTAFEYDLFPVEPEVFQLATFYPIDHARDVLLALQGFMEDAPEAFSAIGVLGHVPEIEEIDGAHHGTACVIVVGAYMGPADEGARVLDTLRHLAEPIADFSGPASFLDVQQFFDADYPSGGRYYWTSARLGPLTDESIAELVALNDAAPSAHSTIDVWFTSGGAFSRVSDDATAFGSRSASLLLGVEANWHDAGEDDANIAWGRRCVAAMQPFAVGGSYLNFPGFGEAGDALVRDALGATYARLQEVKRRYDPDDLFQTHQRVQSAPAVQP